MVALWSADHFWVRGMGGWGDARADSLLPTTISALVCLAAERLASENRHWRPPVHRLPFLLTPLPFSNTGRRDKSWQQPVLRDFWLRVLGSTLTFIISVSHPTLSCHRNVSFTPSLIHIPRFAIDVFCVFPFLLLYLSLFMVLNSWLPAGHFDLLFY